MNATATRRVGAIDAFRAITMYLMLFVNDMAGLSGIPHWMHHAAADEDMLGFSDLIFPAFLFCVGLSVPFAVEARRRRGDDAVAVTLHVVWRTLALVLMGMYILKSEDLHGGIPYHIFSLLMVAGFFLTWLDYPRRLAAVHFAVPALRLAGVGVMAFLLVYCDVHGDAISTGWWGILGLVGWTYLVCALVYVFTRGTVWRLVACWGVVMLFALVSHSDILPWGSGARYLLLPFVPGDWTLHALGMTGVVAGALMMRVTPANTRRFLALLFLAGAVMLGAAFLSHPHWIISKIYATPTWMFFCLAGFLPLAGVLYYVCDVLGRRKWLRPLRAAGTATLTCYMIPYLWYAVQMLTDWWYPEMLNGGLPGLLRSLTFALAVVFIVEALTRAHIRLKV